MTMNRPVSRLVKSTTGRFIIAIAVIGCVTASTASRAGHVGTTVSREPATAAATDPLWVTPQMRLWVHRQVVPRGRARTRLQQLHRALQRFGLRTTVHHTGTARQAFETRSADCVAYAHLFVALARELDLSVSFALFDQPEKTVDRGRVRVDVNHMVAVHGSVGMMVFDIGGISTRPRPAPRRISDGSAAAVLHSNRGVQQLLAGRLEEAKDHLWRATDLDPSFSDAWTNLGVVLRQTGDHAGAELAYRRAVASDPDSLPAWRNLAILLSGTYRKEPGGDQPTGQSGVSQGSGRWASE